MTNGEEHHNPFELDLYFALNEPNAEIERHVAACERCSSYLDELAALHGAGSPVLRAAAPPSASPRAVPPMAAREERGHPARWAKLLALAVPVAALVALGLGRWLPDERDYVAVKGSPAVQLLVKRGRETRLWDGHSRLRAGDAVALRVACEGFSRVSVATIEPGRGAQRLSEGECPRAPEATLPFSLVVDAGPGRERFAVVFSTTPLADAALRAALQAEAPSAAAWVTRFEIDKEAP
jgi:hypothetical protein